MYAMYYFFMLCAVRTIRQGVRHGYYFVCVLGLELVLGLKPQPLLVKGARNPVVVLLFSTLARTH